MSFNEKIPQKPGYYQHRWIDPNGEMREQTLFVGYTNIGSPRYQGYKPNSRMPQKMKCCRPDENLHADRLTPKEWGGWWKETQDDLS